MANVKKIIIITGATCSGKSKIAIQLAKKYNGVIINADSCQVYKQVPILSAQPSKEDIKQTDHLLYGFLDIYHYNINYSVGKYLLDLQQAIQNISNKMPIIVGGTMLYIDAIINGISEIPEIKLQLKNEIRDKYKNYKVNDLFRELHNIDPEYAKIIDKTNPQRLLRGIEVKLATGKSITTYWNNKKNSILNNYEIKKILIELPRYQLYEKINKRFDIMVSKGALEEVKNIFDKCKNDNIDVNKLPKIIGLYEMINYFNDRISLQTAIEQSKQATRNYAKRQLTWFKQKFSNFDKINPEELYKI